MELLQDHIELAAAAAMATVLGPVGWMTQCDELSQECCSKVRSDSPGCWAGRPKINSAISEASVEARLPFQC